MHWTQIVGIALAACIAQMIRTWWGRQKEKAAFYDIPLTDAPNMKRVKMVELAAWLIGGAAMIFFIVMGYLMLTSLTGLPR